MANSNAGMLGRKLGMTQIFDEQNNALGVTLIEITPNRILQVKTTKSKDGYSALQVGYGTRREKTISKPMRGHFAKSGLANVRFVREIRVTDDVAQKYQAGGQLSIDGLFAAGERIDVSGLTKGRGTTGVMKRHNFSGFKRSHGVHEYARHGGSIGTRLTPGMTLAGMPMVGRYGNENVTIQNVKIIKIDTERNVLYVKGGVPGPNGGILRLRKAVK